MPGQIVQIGDAPPHDARNIPQEMPVSDRPQNDYSAAWFVIEANENGGDKAQLALAVAGLTIWRPFDVHRDPTRGRHGKPRRDIRTARFGRYFFIRCAMTDDLAAAVRTTTGVADILGAKDTGKPLPVADAQIDWLKAHRPEDSRATDHLPRLKDRIRINEGPFAGFEGVVTAVDRKGVLKVEIEIFGRPSPMIVESGHVEIVFRAKPSAISAYAKKAA
jgi:transcription antitermination factor NusG